MTVADPPSAASIVVLAPATSRPASTPPHAPLAPRPRPSAAETWAMRILSAGVGVAVAAAIALRFMGPHGLWLDEALTVNISRLPLAKLFEALRHDGSPPAYYLLLHYWMGLFGTGTSTVRALAGVLSVLNLVAAWRLGRAIGGRRLAAPFIVVLACSPFALRYATENRMYSLVMLLATVAALALVRSLQKPSVSRLVGFGVVCGLLLLTHYWALYLIAALGALLLVASLRGPVKTRARMALLALCGGGLLFVPWVPSFIYQVQHTGTPWSTAASPAMLVQALQQFAGWDTTVGVGVFALYVVTFVALATAVVLVALPRGHSVAARLGWRRPVAGSRWVLPATALFVVAMLAAMAGCMVANSAFAYRYASIVLPTVALLVALGIAAIGRLRTGAVAATALLLAIAVAGTAAGAEEVLPARTQATVVAAQIAASARPGDVIAYCPDQLGPAVSRLLPGNLYTQVTFPRWDDPTRINWVDYAQMNGSVNPKVFARLLLNLAGNHEVWLVWESGYRTFGRSCQQMRDTLRLARPDWSVPVHSQPSRYYEHESLVRFSPE